VSTPQERDKAYYVERMFAGIALRYDLMNRLMSLGMDGAWRRAAVAALGCAAGDSVLDVGTGTGDFLPLLNARGCRATGADFTFAMLQAGRAKLRRAASSAPLLAADALRLPFADGTFDGAINGFLLRNVADLPAALTEMLRVLRPGGRIACLEITWPQAPLFRQAFGLYFGRLVPLVGGAISGRPQAYAYLPRSVQAFVTARELAARMEQVGWRDVRYRLLALGTVAIHTARRI
jgi:demethylmenaquinone methyltransferase/2-methoxy-6-polyprenyl-1,4-benzoquinol methylase